MASAKKKDVRELFAIASSQAWPDSAFVTRKLGEFLTIKGRQHATPAKIFMPSFLACTSNMMNKSKLQFTEDWTVTNNLYWIICAPPGTGKTPCMNLSIRPLLKIEDVSYCCGQYAISSFYF